MRPPAFQWYPKDCDSDENVRAMDDREFGFYMRCLNHAWLNNGIPADLERLALVLGRTTTYVRKIWSVIAPCFEPQGDRLVNKKQEILRKNCENFSKKQRERATGGWVKRKKLHTGNDAVAEIRQCSASASASAYIKPTPIVPFLTERNGRVQKPPVNAPDGACLFEDKDAFHHESVVRPPVSASSKNSKRTTEEIRRALNGRFPWWEAFWKVFPCHDGMNPGMSAYERTVKTKELRDQVQAGAERYAARYRADPGMRLKYAQGWLNDQRWTDENLLPVPSKTGRRSTSDIIAERIANGEKPW